MSNALQSQVFRAARVFVVTLVSTLAVQTTFTKSTIIAAVVASVEVVVHKLLGVSSGSEAGTQSGVESGS